MHPPQLSQLFGLQTAKPQQNSKRCLTFGLSSCTAGTFCAGPYSACIQCVWFDSVLFFGRLWCQTLADRTSGWCSLTSSLAADAGCGLASTSGSGHVIVSFPNNSSLICLMASSSAESANVLAPTSNKLVCTAWKRLVSEQIGVGDRRAIPVFHLTQPTI